VVSSYWAIPAAIVASGSAGALALLEWDARLESGGRPLGFTGGPDSARALLSTIATSMLTLTALVFSITVVVLQLASGQFSPRVLRTFLRDQRNQTTLGVFLATFTFALLVLREVRGQDVAVDKFVPGVSIAFCFGLVIVSVAFFVQYIHNITVSIRVIEIIDRISTETIDVIERVHPHEPSEVLPPVVPGDPPTRTVLAGSRGVVTSVDMEGLSEIASHGNATLVVVPRTGDFVAVGMPLVAVHGNGSIDDAQLRNGVTLAKERDIAEDPAFGFRQLVDIAERALSPGINDPTTAAQCLDHLHDLLRRLVDRPLPGLVTCTGEDRGLVVAPRFTWDDYVALAVDEIAHWGAESIQVRQRTVAMLEDLAANVPPDRVPVLHERLRLLADAQRT
jgi:uncharacterized membrane protein